MISIELQNKVQSKVDETVALIEKSYGIRFSNPITVRYDIRGVRLGGQALFNGNIVRLNPVFLIKYGEEYINSTVPHEVVHIGVWEKYIRHDGFSKVAAHGSEWKSMMRKVGAPPIRCHSYKVDEQKQAVSRSPFIYKCNKCDKSYQVGYKVHEKIRGGRTYYPVCCGKSSTLIFDSQLVPDIQQPNNTPSSSKTIPSLTSKLGKCYDYYRRNYNKDYSRQFWINQFVVRFECTPAGASTYLNTCKKLYS